MKSVPQEANSYDGSGTMTIDRPAVDPNHAGVAGTGPAAELAEALQSMTEKEVCVNTDSSRHRAGGITVDLVVSGPRGSFGILCDAIDSARLRRSPMAMEELGVRGVYCVSAVDSMLDPVAVAHSIARHEPGFFRAPRVAARRPLPVEHIGRQDPGRRLPRRSRAADTPGTTASRAA